MSGWISDVHAGQPRNAVTVIYIFGALLLCTILPSPVAFFSLISAGGLPIVAAYGLIALLRLTMTPELFKTSKFYLGHFRKPAYVVAILGNGLICAVSQVAICMNSSNRITTTGPDLAIPFPSHCSEF